MIWEQWPLSKVSETISAMQQYSDIVKYVRKSTIQVKKQAKPHDSHDFFLELQLI